MLLQDPAELETFPRAFGRAFRLKVVPIDSLRLCESLCASLVRFRCALSALQAFQTLFPVNANVPNLLLREVGCRQSCFPAELAASAFFCACFELVVLRCPAVLLALRIVLRTTPGFKVGLPGYRSLNSSKLRRPTRQRDRQCYDTAY